MNPTGEEVGRAIEHMAEIYSTEEYFTMCEQSLRIFRDKFDADRNFSILADELEQITD